VFDHQSVPRRRRGESLATVRHAIELGVNWIDTAAVYGLGHSEQVVGRLLRELTASDRPFIFTNRGSRRSRETERRWSRETSTTSPR